MFSPAGSVQMRLKLPDPKPSLKRRHDDADPSDAAQRPRISSALPPLRPSAPWKTSPPLPRRHSAVKVEDSEGYPTPLGQYPRLTYPCPAASDSKTSIAPLIKPETPLPRYRAVKNEDWESSAKPALGQYPSLPFSLPPLASDSAARYPSLAKAHLLSETASVAASEGYCSKASASPPMSHGSGHSDRSSAQGYPPTTTTASHSGTQYYTIAAHPQYAQQQQSSSGYGRAYPAQAAHAQAYTQAGHAQAAYTTADAQYAAQAGHYGVYRGAYPTNSTDNRCWDHGCAGRQFSTFSNLLRHQREKNGQAGKSYCEYCGAEFTRGTAKRNHEQSGRCRAMQNMDQGPGGGGGESSQGGSAS